MLRRVVVGKRDDGADEAPEKGPKRSPGRRTSGRGVSVDENEPFPVWLDETESGQSELCACAR